MPASEFTRDTRVIARTDRGLEAGEVRCEATEAALDALADVAEGQILRAMTAEDLRNWPACKTRPIARWKPASSTCEN